MFPHVITIYRYNPATETITRQTVSGVYWYGSRAVSPNGNGTVESDAATIITSPETAQDYGSRWTVQPKDRVIRGIGPSVASLKEIKGGITVLTVDENICGSSVDNITITGR